MSDLSRTAYWTAGRICFSRVRYSPCCRAGQFYGRASGKQAYSSPVISDRGRNGRAERRWTTWTWPGTWANGTKIAKFPQRFEKGLVGVTANYTLLPNGKVRVLNSGISSETSTVTRRPPTARPGSLTRSSNAKLKVSFFFPSPPTTGYWSLVTITNTPRWANRPGDISGYCHGRRRWTQGVYDRTAGTAEAKRVRPIPAGKESRKSEVLR